MSTTREPTFRGPNWIDPKTGEPCFETWWEDGVSGRCIHCGRFIKSHYGGSMWAEYRCYDRGHDGAPPLTIWPGKVATEASVPTAGVQSLPLTVVPGSETPPSPLHMRLGQTYTYPNGSTITCIQTTPEGIPHEWRCVPPPPKPPAEGEPLEDAYWHFDGLRRVTRPAYSERDAFKAALRRYTARLMVRVAATATAHIGELKDGE